MSNQVISEEVSSALVAVFQQNPGVRYMNFSGSNVVERMNSLGPILRCPQLRLYSLNLSLCRLGSSGQLKSLAEALSSMHNPLSELSLTTNNLDVSDMTALAPYLASNTQLTLLDLSMNENLGDASLVLLSEALSRAGHPLQSLAISGIGLTDDAHTALASLVLDDRFKAEFLDISWNLVGLNGVARVANVAARAKSVRELHMMSMKLGTQGLKQFVSGLRENPNTLEVIHFASNYFPEDCTDVFTELLAIAPQLKWVDIMSNTLNVQWISGMKNAINNSHLSILSVQNGVCADEGAQAWAEVLIDNHSLLDLHLSYSNISDAGAIALANALKVNTTLLYLRLDTNEIGYAGAEAILQALQVNKTLLYLDISENDFDANEFDGMAFPDVPNRVIKLFESL